MRHILTNIFLLISLISVGQNQQVLRNGFVVGTDNGVWYLQDGFNEWVQLGDSVNFLGDDLFDIYYGDYSISVSNNGYFLSGKVGFSTTGNYFLFRPTTYYGSKNYFLENSTYDIDSSHVDVFADFIDKDWMIISYGGSNNESVINYFQKEASTFCYSITGSFIASDGDTDKDSTLLVVGDSNGLTKFYLDNDNGGTGLCTNITKSNISGLHSRSTDSHKICYNYDDDEFIIVSDSGIVYTYDKTILTTIDTLPNLPSTNTIKEVYDIEYVGGKLFVTIGINEGTLCYYIIYNTVTNTFSSYVFSGYLESWASEPLLARYKDVGVLNNMCNYLISQPYLIIKTDGSTENVANIGNVNRKIFDLDYINYLQ